jgi:hypothetical protein
MSAVSKNGNPSLASVLPPANHKISGLYVGADVNPGDACYVKSDGLIYPCLGTSGSAEADVWGYAPIGARAAQNDGLTLLHGVNFAYGSGLTPGTKVYLSSTVRGGLDTSPPYAGALPVGAIIDTTRIELRQAFA